MSTKDLSTVDEFEAYLKELRITYHFSCFKENNAEGMLLDGPFQPVSRHCACLSQGTFRSQYKARNFSKCTYTGVGPLSFTC